MTRKPRKGGVQDIIKNLVDSEIPEIQAVAKQLNEWTKQLEEHSWKLQHYASEIESIAAAEAAEGRDEAGLAELVKDLEKTLADLRGGSGRALPEGRKPSIELERSEPDVTAVEEVKEDRREAGTLQLYETYTTPEGFVVRKIRR